MGNDANITLRIDSDAGQAVKGLLTMEQAERKLEVAVKAGNSTLKLRANTEAELAKILPAIAAADERAAKSFEKRHKAMGAGFGRTALLALNDADEANFKRKMASQAVAMDKTRVAAGGAAAAASGMASSLAAITTGGGIAAGALAALEASFNNSLAKAERANTKAGTMKDFIAALPADAEGKKFGDDVLGMGAAVGIGPDATAALAGPLMAAADKDGSGKLDVKEKAAFTSNMSGGLKMGRVGVEQRDATDLILAGETQGIAGTRTADMALKAAEISMRGPGVFAKSASSLSQFSDLAGGLAITTALTKSGESEAMIPQRVKDVGLALSSAADKDDFSKKHGLAGLSEMQKVAKLRTSAEASGDVKKFTDDFKKQGLDEGKALAMAQLIQQGGAAISTFDTLNKMAPGFSDEKITQLETNPLSSSRMAQEKTVALGGYNDMVGPGSQEAKGVFDKELARGNRLIQFGGDQAVDASTGLPKQVSLLHPLQSLDAVMGTVQAGMNGMPMFDRGGIAPNVPKPSEDLAQSQKGLVEALTRNNELLAINNNVTAAANQSPAKKATGGAVSNAEEKY